MSRGPRLIPVSTRPPRRFIAGAVGLGLVLLSAGWAAGQQAAAPGATARTVRLDVTRDTWVSAYKEGAKDETTANLGGEQRLKLKGIQEFPLLDIDPAPLAGQVVRSATLHLRSRASDVLRRVSVSSLASDWEEGTGRAYRPLAGAASFAWAKQDQQPWAWPGSDILAVSFGAGHTFWRFADATPPDAKGWQTVAVDPRVLALRVAGISRGFVLMDDVGSEYQRDGEKVRLMPFLNRYVASREAGRDAAPYFEVVLGEADALAPPSVGSVLVEPAESLPAGEAVVTWATPRDFGTAGTVGFLVRYVAAPATFNWDRATPLPQYLVPAIQAPGELVRLHVRDLGPGVARGSTLTLGVRAVDGAGNLGPTALARVTLSNREPWPLPGTPERAFTEPAPAPMLAGTRLFIIDPLDKVDPRSGRMIPEHDSGYTRCNHLWSAANRVVRLHAARNEHVAFQIVLEGKTAEATVKLAFPEAGLGSVPTELYRLRHVTTPGGPWPDVLVPLAQGKLSIPATDEKIADQNLATVLADIYVPHRARPGKTTGTLQVSVGAQKATIAVELNVWNFTLPDHLSLIPEMNSYGLPDPPAEVAYYRLAQVHRTCLNRLGYNWKGQPGQGLAPKWDGRFMLWQEWDSRFGPLLDGSAFADLPRKGVPVETFYLPLNENWPASIETGFRGGYWADQALTAEYRQEFVAACRRVAQHLAQKGWNDTIFQFYLNNKLIHKKALWSASSAPWVFDEPVNTQDFWALRWYALAFHEGVRDERRDVKLAWRCDVSRPQFQRDLFDGLLDVNVVGGAFRDYRRLVLERKTRCGEIAFNYGSTHPPDRSNLQPVGWCLESWCQGLDGVLPWQTIGNDKSWDTGDALALFYPGGRIGRQEPSPSVRLKAYRSGQQLVEYLTLLTQASRQPRWAVAEAVLDELRLAGQWTRHGAEDAGQVDYDRLDPVALWALRTRIGSALSAAAPPPRDRLVDLRPTPRDPDRLPPAGDVQAAPEP